MKHLIIGNGIAGISAAEAIRRHDSHADITIVGDETFLPYSRPMISYVLAGEQPHAKLPIRSPDFYDKHRIDARLGQRVTQIDVAAGEVVLTDRNRISYEKLLIAAGADPRPLKADGLQLTNIFYMRTEAHAAAQVRALQKAGGVRRAVVLGGGLVGFKAAYGLLRRGVQVTMLISSGYPLSMQVDPVAGKMILDEMVRHGLTVEVGVSVTSFTGRDKVTGAVTDDGRELPCDMVIIGKGVLPCRDFIPRESIKVDLGVLVDTHLQTSAPDIYAAGDVAELYDLARGCRWVNALWPEAACQGRVAGENMAGRRVTYPGSLSRNVMRVFGLDVLTVGETAPRDESGYTIFQQTNRTGYAAGTQQTSYRRLVVRENRLVGAVLIGDIEQGGLLQSLIANQTILRQPPELLLRRNFNVAQLL